MQEEKDQKTAAPGAEEKETVAPEGKTDIEKKEPSQDPLDKELEKIHKKGEGRTKKEKLIYTKNRVEQQIAELEEEEGDEPELEDEDDEKPVTVGMLKQLEKTRATKNAMDLAEEIEDSRERELVKHHLRSTIRSSGNPQEDLRNARVLVNSVKNTKIIEEVQRKGEPKRHGSAPSAGARKDPDALQNLTEEEKAIMQMKGFDGKPLLTEADIIKARGS